MIRPTACVFAALTLLTLAAPARADGTLDRVRAAGRLSCGVVTEEPDYNKDQRHGGLDDLGGELCKAIAAAVLGKDARATISALPTEQAALKALMQGSVDVLAGVTPAPSTATLDGVAFGPPFFFDGQGFLVHRESGIASLRDLAGRTICYLGNTEHDDMLNAVLPARGISFVHHPFEETGEMDAALVTGHCDAITADVTELAEERAAFHAMKADFVILPETITLDPVAPAVRAGDPQWAAIVAYTFEALVGAEAAGLTQDNIATARAGNDPVLRRLLGVDRAAAQALGLPDDWAVQAIRAVGNWGEVYARTMGPGTEHNLPRGMNALWRDGGLLAPLPLR